MKKSFCFLLFISALTACKKHNTENTSFESIIGKYLICDSVTGTDHNGIATTTTFGKGKGLDIQFGANTYTTYVVPPVEFNYLYKKQDTVFYWAPNQQLTDRQYFLVTVKGKKVKTWESIPFVGATVERFYHYE